MNDSISPQLHPLDEHNRALVSNVHPPGWVNPEPRGRYNLVVIGAGTGGLVAAAGAAGLGARVALIERHLMGGDCLNTGCVPSKALLRAARAAADARSAGDFGVSVSGDVSVDFPAVMQRMRRLRADISPNDSAGRFRAMGVDVFLGDARFASPDAIEVAGRRIEFSRAVIATGTRPAVPPIPGLSEAGCLTNETIFSLTELPRRLAILGGGPIGVELAQAFARFGSAVTLIEMEPRLLMKEDPDAAEIVREALMDDGVEMRLGHTLQRVRRDGDETVLALDASGDTSEARADALLVAAGRTPNTDALNLDAAGIDTDGRRVRVDDHLRTTNRRVFAVGDVCSPYPFTHVADAMARIVIQNALFFGRKKFSALTVPWCTYTDPEVAQVGLNETSAARRGIRFDRFVVDLGDVDRAILDGEIGGFLKVLTRRRSGSILGATLVARHAGEMISEITLAMVAGRGLGALGRTIHPYPTQAEVFRKAADNFNRTRLTPRVKMLFERLMAWRR